MIVPPSLFLLLGYTRILQVKLVSLILAKKLVPRPQNKHFQKLKISTLRNSLKELVYKFSLKTDHCFSLVWVHKRPLVPTKIFKKTPQGIHSRNRFANNTTPFYDGCISNFLLPFLECNIKCSRYARRYFNPVCSSDGRVFRNNCDFQEYKCFKHGKVSSVSCHKKW